MSFKKEQNVLVAVSSEPDKKYKAIVRNISKDAITLEIPSVPVGFNIDTPITVWFWDDHAIYSFDTVTISDKPKVVALFSVKKPSTIKRSFKRSYKRIKVELPVIIKDIHGFEKENGTLIDLSAGGAKIIANSGKKKGDSFKISFTLPDGQIFDDIACDILRTRNINDNRVEYGVVFRSLSKIRQQRLSDSIADAILNHNAEVLE